MSTLSISSRAVLEVVVIDVVVGVAIELNPIIGQKTICTIIHMCTKAFTLA